MRYLKKTRPVVLSIVVVVEIVAFVVLLLLVAAAGTFAVAVLSGGVALRFVVFRMKFVAVVSVHYLNHEINHITLVIKKGLFYKIRRQIAISRTFYSLPGKVRLMFV